MSDLQSPVIIIGMHRSGTTMITRLLEKIGLFVGSRKDKNYEALFFQRINQWFISQSGGRWDYPEPLHDVMVSDEIRKLISSYVRRYLLTSPRTISFLGWRKYLRYRSPLALDVPWGWKSPLSTYTLPLWLDLFPNAKVLHIYRHGVDVAQSLRARGKREMHRGRLQEIYYLFPFLHWLRPKPGKFIDSVRCDSLEGGLSLWEDYLEEARTNMIGLDGRALEVKYEEFLSEPIVLMKQLAEFCGLPCDEAAVEQISKAVKTERAYAYRKQLDLRAFSDRSAESLRRQGY
jgi:hypothetical protein